MLLFYDSFAHELVVGRGILNYVCHTPFEGSGRCSRHWVSPSLTCSHLGKRTGNLAEVLTKLLSSKKRLLCFGKVFRRKKIGDCCSFPFVFCRFNCLPAWFNLKGPRP